ncbi:MAG: type II CRISPR RNA-guided endonuclease Cas9, partial [Clostridia bacterium]|nr:type II CRISPR RNA-guided endonuclease Cas9 [Clostridia bacterium]
MEKTYRLGLDIGIGSVGWAVLENDPVTEEPTQILKVGVRTFDVNEIAKTGESTAKSRREARGVHRRTRRRALRISKAKALMSKAFGIDIEKALNDVKNQDVYALRAKALDEKISLVQIIKVVLNIYKRRGFFSTRKANAKKDDEGKLLTAVTENSNFLKDNDYRTIGEAIFKDSERFKTMSCGETIYNIRNHGDYKNCFLREDLKNELRLILTKQQEFYKEITEELIEELIEVFARQRTFDEGPGEPSPYTAKFEIGNCTFIEGEKRAPKASYTFELFSALSKINSLKINDENLTDEQKTYLIEKIKEKESLKFSEIRKAFDIGEDKTFNLCRYISKKKGEEIPAEEIVKNSEAVVFVTMKNSHAIAKALGVENKYENRKLIDVVALMLSLCKSDSTIDEYIKNNEELSKLTVEQIEKVRSLDFDKFGSLSFKAMEKVLPHLERGLRYDEACKAAGFSHSSFEHEKMKYLKGEKIEERLKDVTSNVVKRAVNQTLRIINEIISRYGSPQFITIELARELSKSRKERNEIDKRQQKNAEENAKTKAILTDEYKNQNPTGLDILKYRLYNEQEGKCMYSGKTIDVNRLFEPNYLQIDHILPYSKSLNDSYNNKVLVLADENQRKGNRTPYEYFGNDSKRWNEFVSRVNLLKNKEKQRFLLKERFDEDDQKEYRDRNLNDTRYMSKFLLNLFQDFLLMKESKKYKKVVRSVNGAVTSYLRRCWGIQKIRDDGDNHHAIDAAVIATVGDGQVQKITKFNKFKENFVYDESNDVYISRLTGEVMTEEQKAEYQQKGIEVLGKKLPPPYRTFVDELKLRTRINYEVNDFIDKEKLSLAKMGYEPEDIDNIRPLFVSRMKTVKKTGAIHKETMMSTREYDETKCLIKSVPISSLKKSTNAEIEPLKDDKYPEFSIENYYRPQDDRL